MKRFGIFWATRIMTWLAGSWGWTCSGLDWSVGGAPGRLSVSSRTFWRSMARAVSALTLSRTSATTTPSWSRTEPRPGSWRQQTHSGWRRESAAAWGTSPTAWGEAGDMWCVTCDVLQRDNPDRPEQWGAAGDGPGPGLVGWGDGLQLEQSYGGRDGGLPHQPGHQVKLTKRRFSLLLLTIDQSGGGAARSCSESAPARASSQWRPWWVCSETRRAASTGQVGVPVTSWCVTHFAAGGDFPTSGSQVSTLGSTEARPCHWFTATPGPARWGQQLSEKLIFILSLTDQSSNLSFSDR